jgi:catechol 2,3-dioxygenase-like lactoylglutathione lyase family enzyme
MKVRRIVANVAAQDTARAKAFYQDVLGLDILMDYGWIATYGSPVKAAVQISFASQGGSGTPMPDLSIEVDDIEEVLRRFKIAGVKIEYGPVWVSQGRLTRARRSAPRLGSGARGRTVGDRYE